LWRSLKQSYGEVRKLYADIHASALGRRDWTATVYARRTLGADAQVTAWFLAEYFLLAWHDWRSLFHRYTAYFGPADAWFPRAWQTLESNCHLLARRLLGDSGLDQLVAQSWLGRAAVSRPNGQGGDPTRAICHAMVDNHRRLTLLAAEEALPEPADRPSEEYRMPELIWPVALDTIVRLNRALVNDWDDLPWDVREPAMWHLRHYQRANLLASWFVADDHSKDARTLSALLHALRKDRPVVPTIKQFVEQLKIGPQDRNTVEHVLRRVQAAVADFGYDHFVEDVTARDFQGGDGSPVGSAVINLIPSERKGSCCTTLLAVSKGDKKALGFPSIMKELRQQLIRCTEKTRVVIVLCDHWFPGMLDEHLGDLRAHHGRGVRFLFLMAGTPGRTLAPVGVDLGASP
jgi:hypothetical protein